MSIKKFRDGSEGASDRKTVSKFKVFMTLSTIAIIILLWTVPLLKSEAAQTSVVSKIFSWILFGLCFLTIYLEEKINDALSSDTAFYVIWFLLFAGAFLLRIAGGV